MKTFTFAGFICVAILSLCCTAAYSQPFRKLTVDDFKGRPNPGNGETVAYTNCAIQFSYVAKKERDYYLLDFTILLTMDNNASWMDRSRVTSNALMAEILKHEQGHYNIAYMEQQEVLRILSKTVFRENYQVEAKSIFNRLNAKYKQLNYDYDNDTQHMVNRVQQHSWDEFFRRQLSTEYLANN
jgi:hypothetical protein